MGACVIDLREASADAGGRAEAGRLLLALEAAGIGTWEWDLSSGEIHWDRRMHELYGLAPGAFSGRYDELLQLLYPQDRGVLAEQLTRIGEGGEGEAREVTFRIRLPDGRIRHLADRSEALLDDDGRIRCLIGVTWDITQRKNAEAELERARRQSEAANLAMRQDLDAAARVQRALLPPPESSWEGAETAWRYHPCETLAGDGLNLMSLGDRYLLAYVVDVCGHGVPSSLLAVSVSHQLAFGLGGSPLAVQEGGEPVPPGEVARRLNRRFQMEQGAALFFTLLYGVLDREEGCFRYVSAGNPGPLLLRRHGGAILHDRPGLPVGILPTAEYEEGLLVLEPGDRLYLFTDGVLEERDAEGRAFGRGRLRRLLERHRQVDLGGSLELLTRALEEWRGPRAQGDDLAMVAMEYRG